ncbi:MAG: B12-binding domain-containing radical SAM protein [Desulfobacterota bacterium]|nr:B12-binding domain-containing radical SAM protein [Thermodesulfobacteriota bacterium]
MNALLLYPEVPETFWSFKHALKFIRKKATSPPLGLLTIASLLPRKWNKRLIDLNVRRLTHEDLSWADVALVSAMIVQRDSARKTIARCKEAGLRVIAGGPLFTTEYDQFDQVDHFVLNEAELTLPPFLEDLAKGSPKRLYSTSDFPDLRKTPPPMWELIRLKDYASMPVQFSRGCPFNCEFCNVTTLFGHKPRTKSAAQMIEELERLYQRGWRGGVFFVDDNLIGNKTILKNELLPALIEWRKDKRGFLFNTEASINLADDLPLMEKMVRAGFDKVFIGIESPNEDGLAECSKKQNLNRNLVEDVKRIQRAGLQVQAGFILGFDSDSPLTFRRLTDFIQKTGIVTAMVGLLQAPPGTKLYERLKQAGRLLDRLSGDNGDGTTNIIPVMNREVLGKGYREVLHYLYSPRTYYQRVKTFLREYHPPKIYFPLNFRGLSENAYAFFRSMVRLGIVGKERFQYWKLFLWTLARRPRSFPLAIELAIYGFHFRKTTEGQRPKAKTHGLTSKRKSIT